MTVESLSLSRSNPVFLLLRGLPPRLVGQDHRGPAAAFMSIMAPSLTWAGLGGRLSSIHFIIPSNIALRAGSLQLLWQRLVILTGVPTSIQFGHQEQVSDRMSQFQLFPPLSPQDKTAANPFCKGKRKKPTNARPASPIALEELQDSAKTETVLFQIIEDTNAVPKPPKAHISRSKSPAQHESGTSKPNSRETPRRPSNENNTPGRQTSSSSSVRTGSTTLVNSTNKSVTSPPPQSSASAASADVPMRSIFPQYNFSLPLNQQKYYPQPTANIPRRRPTELRLSPPLDIDQALGPRTVPPSAMGFPAGISSPVEMRFSSHAELTSLWEAANGQRPEELPGTFNLQMAK